MTYFGYTEGLLFHGFMDAGSVILTNAVELVNTTQAAIGENQRPCLQLPLTTILQCNAHVHVPDN